jgi:RNA polymerase sigma-70 factor (ECF subfamily)
MPAQQTLTGDFQADLTAMLPRLRIYAMSLTRDGDRADDLVQQTVVNSLAGAKSFRPGTNFPGWLFRIERNEFITGLRRQRPTVELTDAIAGRLSHPPQQEAGIVMREFKQAFRTLRSTQRQALLMTALDGHTHQTIAAQCKVSIGTVKSRVSRARTRLRQLLDDGVGSLAASAQRRPGGPVVAVA